MITTHGYHPLSFTLPLFVLALTANAGLAQDSDRDGLPDTVDSSPIVDYRPGFDWLHCAPMDLDPDNDAQPECKARERIARHLAKQGIHVKKIAFSVVKNGQVHFADAFEIDASRKILHDPDGIHRLFRIGSTTKSMVAVAAKRLEEKKVLSLDDWVSDDDASKLVTGGKRTLRHLLTHQGAFKLDSGHVYLFGYPGTLRAFWREKDDKISPHYNSSNYGNLGGGYVYSAFNYSLAGAYLEAQAGRTLEQILQSEVWDASRMSTATVDGKRANKAPIGGTTGICKNSSMHLGPYINLVSPTDPYCTDNFYSSNDVYGSSNYTQQSYRLDECSEVARDPAGGVMASVVDMAQFACTLLDSYHGRGGLVSPAGIRDLWKPSHDFACGTNCPYQRYYAVGFFVDTPSGKPITEVEHAGSRAGYQSAFVLRPEADTAVSILVNANVDSVALNRVAKNILDDFAKPLNGLFYAYGQGCRGSTGAVPTLAGQGSPILGSQFAALLAKAPAKTAAILFLGDSRVRWGALPLPLDLGFIGAPGCLAQASGLLQLPVLVSSSGTAQFPFAIPNPRALTGDRLFGQALVLDSRANQFGVTVSNGLEIRIGG